MMVPPETVSVLSACTPSSPVARVISPPEMATSTACSASSTLSMERVPPRMVRMVSAFTPFWLGVSSSACCCQSPQPPESAWLTDALPSPVMMVSEPSAMVTKPRSASSSLVALMPSPVWASMAMVPPPMVTSSLPTRPSSTAFTVISPLTMRSESRQLIPSR